MKKFIIISVFLIFIAVSAFGGTLRRDDNGVPVQSFAPWAFRMYSTTKRIVSAGTNTKIAMRIRATAAGQVFLNTTSQVNGAGWPLAANVTEEYALNPSISDIVFKPVSSASTAKTKVYFQFQ